MTSDRIATTVDADLLVLARRVRPWATDEEIADEAFRGLLSLGASVDVDDGAYERHPIDAPDAWGDLGAFRRAAGSS